MAAEDVDPLLVVKKIWDENKTADLEEIQRLVRLELGISKNHAAAASIDYATANLLLRLVQGEREAPPPMMQ